MEDVQALKGNAALQDIDDSLKNNWLHCRILGLPIPNNPMFIKPIHSVNEEADHGANIVTTQTSHPNTRGKNDESTI